MSFLAPEAGKDRLTCRQVFILVRKSVRKEATHSSVLALVAQLVKESGPHSREPGFLDPLQDPLGEGKGCPPYSWPGEFHGLHKS